jgi:NAD(P)-dependent dehydrogenase (short-subunit alcohol dehydrogenase family)
LFAALPEVDVLVNNLGIFGPVPLLEVDDALWQRYWDVNVMSAIRLTRGYIAGMRDRGWGRVQFMASDSAVVIPEEMVHYGVTKTALLGVSRGFAKAVAGSGVTVNAVIAGPTHTEGVESFVRELVGDELPWDEAAVRFVKEYRPTSLIQRLIEPVEIANLCAYLASDLASATTGGAIRVDGGFVDNIVL